MWLNVQGRNWINTACDNHVAAENDKLGLCDRTILVFFVVLYHYSFHYFFYSFFLHLHRL